MDINKSPNDFDEKFLQNHDIQIDDSNKIWEDKDLRK